MRKDIIESLLPKVKKKRILYRTAERNVNGIGIRLELIYKWYDEFNWMVKAISDNRSPNKYFFATKFGANYYFNKLKKKYKLKDIDLMVDAL